MNASLSLPADSKDILESTPKSRLRPSNTYPHNSHSIGIKHGSKKSRNRNLRKDDWEKQRSQIIKFYIDENMTLEDMMRAMESDCGFVAERHMYLHRIKQWNLQKNYKASEKDAVAQAMAQPSSVGSGQAVCLIRGRPAQMKRIHRHLREQRKLLVDSAWQASEIVFVNNDALRRDRYSPRNLSITTSSRCKASSERGSSGSSGLICWSHERQLLQLERGFHYSPRLENVEKLSIRTNELLCRLLAQEFQPVQRSDSSVHDEHTFKIDTFFRLLNSAAAGLDQNDTLHHGSQLERACAGIRDILQQAHWKLILLMFAWFPDFQARDPGSAKLILKYMYHMARTLYPDVAGSQHCLVHFFHLWLVIDDFDESSEVLGHVLRNIASTMTTRGSYIDTEFAISTAFFYETFHRDEMALSVLGEAFDYSLHNQPLNLANTIYIARHLACVYLRTEKYREGHAVLQSFMQTLLDLDRNLICNYLAFAELCLANSNTNDSVEFFSRELEICQRLPRLYRGEMEIESYCDRMLELIHQTQGKPYSASTRYSTHSTGIGLADENFWYLTSI